MFDLLEVTLHAQTVLEVGVEEGGQRVDFMADYRRTDVVVTLGALHAEGPGPNILGLSGVRIIAQEVLEFLNAETMEIQGAVRTSGARPGRLPGAVVFKRQR
jgi:hypothetical protein